MDVAVRMVLMCRSRRGMCNGRSAGGHHFCVRGALRLRRVLSFKHAGNAVFSVHGPPASQKFRRAARISRRSVPDCHARHEGRPLRAFRHLRLRPQRRRRHGPDHQPGPADAFSRPSRPARHHGRAGGDPAAAEGARLRGPQRRPGRPQPRLRPAFRRLQGGILAAGVERHLPHRDGRHIARHLERARPASCADGARLFRLGRRPARERDRRERLADLSGKRRNSCSTPTSSASTTASWRRSASTWRISAMWPVTPERADTAPSAS